ncbi:MAG: hypothetical protein QOI83_4469, partial [Streptomycetaceae bacterium]|nr:hypothetical protein [Streptomycetaceae bacterium]
MHISGTDRSARVTVFSPRIDDLLRKYRGAEVFRLDAGTVGVAEPVLIDDLLRSRPANEFERPTFKPLQGKSISRAESSAVMRAVSQDVRAALKKPAQTSVDLSGEWPQVGHAYLRDLIFGPDPFRLRVLMDR